jgi:hypothetical protein|tara:strand:- start:17289 stop:17492 length:204 start_codon:yes stop_codon:yes gene_type:complete
MASPKPKAQKKFHYYSDKVYGNPLIYPLESEFQVAHTLLAGRKTLNKQDFEAYKSLGVQLEEAEKPV